MKFSPGTRPRRILQVVGVAFYAEQVKPGGVPHFEAAAQKYREMAPDVFIIARHTSSHAHEKFIRAGGRVFYDADSKQRDVEDWLAAHTVSSENQGGHDHTHGVASFCLIFDTPLDWTAFGIWMTMLQHRHGENVLRIKGMLNVAGQAAPVLINGVQHIVHPPTHLDAWPDADHRSRIVFITRGLERTRIEVSLAAFNRLANPVAATAA